MATIDELKTAATTIQNASTEAENTAQRVGQLFNDILTCFAVMLQEAGATQNGYMTAAMWSKLNGLSNYDDAEIRKLITDGLAGKVSAETGKGLSTEDFTTELLNKLQTLQNFDPSGINEAIRELMNSKQNIEPGKGLSTEDFTTELLKKLQGLQNFDPSGLNEAIRELMNSKQDIEPGKGLSTEDFTTELLNKLKGLQNFDPTSINEAISLLESTKVSKVPGKGLSTEDFTTAHLKKLLSLQNFDPTSINEAISLLESTKVSKITGKGLSTNDLTNELLQKLKSLSNYNDTEIRAAIELLRTGKVDAEEGKTLIKVSEAEKLSRMEEKVILSDIVESVKTASRTDLDGTLVYDSDKNLLLWKVTYPDNNNPTYYESSSIEQRAGHSPEKGIIYICGQKTYIGINGGLFYFGDGACCDDNVIDGGNAFSQYGPNDTIGGGSANQ